MREGSKQEPSTATMEIPPERKVGMFWLEIAEGNRTWSLAVAEGCGVVVGSHPTADIRVHDRTVSAKHCAVRCADGRLAVQDLDSLNGTYVGGARVRTAELMHGACVVVGRVAIHVRCAQAIFSDPPCAPLPKMVGHSPAMLDIAARVRRLAPLSVPVLVRGATGTGKDLVARALHDLSARSSRPFVAINAGAIPKELASAELFGHDRGAFTGAHVRRDGAFVTANGGTLFLDEVGELGADVQVKLLRALEEGEIRPIGSSACIKVNVRVVAATWAPLEQLVEQGRFREDLYHRLAVAVVHLPALSDRRGDIPALVDHFLRCSEHELGPKQVAPGALAQLVGLRWSGNVRQLRNVVLRAALSSRSNVITAADLDAALHELPVGNVRMPASSARAVVASCDGKVAAAARACGVPRSTFRDWLRAGA